MWQEQLQQINADLGAESTTSTVSPETLQALQSLTEELQAQEAATAANTAAVSESTTAVATSTEAGGVAGGEAAAGAGEGAMSGFEAAAPALGASLATPAGVFTGAMAAVLAAGAVMTYNNNYMNRQDALQAMPHNLEAENRMGGQGLADQFTGENVMNSNGQLVSGWEPWLTRPTRFSSLPSGQA